MSEKSEPGILNITGKGKITKLADQKNTLGIVCAVPKGGGNAVNVTFTWAKKPGRDHEIGKCMEVVWKDGKACKQLKPTTGCKPSVEC